MALTAWLLVTEQGAAQSAAATGEIPEKPADHILDQDRILLGEEEAAKRLRAALSGLQDRYDFPVFLVLSNGMIGTTPGEQARKYHRYCLGEKSEGLVVAVDFKSREFMAWEFSQKMYSRAFVDLGIEARLDYYELRDAIVESKDQARELLGGKKTEGLARDQALAYLVTRMEVITEDLGRRLQGPESDLRGGDQRRSLMGWMALLMVGLGLLMAVLVRLTGRAEVKAKREYRFPEVLVGERLGARCGGGKISSASFGSPSSEP
ncbi:MAG: hypothetical protein ACQKBY_05595 [Verrucomicrobiales bacterium]